MKYISVVIPAYNEALRIGVTLREIALFLSLIEEETEIIIVNDGSTDGTELIIRRFMANLNDMTRFKTQVIYLNEKTNRGKGFALRKGLMEATGRYVLFTDADNSTSIRETNKLLPYVKSDYDIAIGSRSIAGSVLIKRQTYIRQMMGKIFNLFVRLCVLKGFIDTQCGFKLFRREAVRSIIPKSKIDGFAFDVEILYIARKSDFKVIEVPITWENHPDSRVKLFSSSYRMLKDLLTIKSLHKKRY